MLSLIVYHSKKCFHSGTLVKINHCAVVCYGVREATLAGSNRVVKEDGTTNLDKVLTTLMPEVTQATFCDYLMY